MNRNSLEFYKAHPIEFIEKFIQVNKKPIRLNNSQKNLIKALISNY